MKYLKLGSIMKKPSRSTEKLANNLNESSKILVPDGLDGWNAIYFAFKGYKVTVYESNPIFINGGTITVDNKIYLTHGLRKRIEVYGLQNTVNYKTESFYDCENLEKYNLVYVNRSLNRKCNSHVSIKDKVNSLKAAVSEGGELYLVYFLAEDENDYIKYPANQYPRSGEIPSYFNDEWSIIFVREVNKTNNKFVKSSKLYENKIGYVHAKRKIKVSDDNTDSHVYRYSINIRRNNL